MPESTLKLRRATLSDVPVLAAMNRQLIQDEAHRNRMTDPELAERMSGWLERGEYEAALFNDERGDVGYALYRYEPEHVYLRQLFIVRERRREGLGRRALALLRKQVWQGRSRVRVDVLVSNTRAIAFWQAVGFKDYCITMEWSETEGEKVRK